MVMMICGFELVFLLCLVLYFVGRCVFDIRFAERMGSSCIDEAKLLIIRLD